MTDVMILCGGMGSRLKDAFPSLPKGLAPIHGRPFLDFLTDKLVDQGFGRIVFCVGHRAEQIIDRYATRGKEGFAFSRETIPLGTGGAARQALDMTESDPVVVMNGDSFCQVDFTHLISEHLACDASLTMALVRSTGRNDVGTVQLNDNGRIVAFGEKTVSVDCEERLVNAGIYLFKRSLLAGWPLSRSFSLEYDLFPNVVLSHPCYGKVVEGPLIDIGTPERYAAACQLL